MKVAWLCPYPVDQLPSDKVQWNNSKKFHPATWIVNLSDALSQIKGIELHVITETAWVQRDFRFSHNDTVFHVLRRPYSLPCSARGLPNWIPLDLLTFNYLDKRKLTKEIRLIKPDIIHVHGVESFYGLGALGQAIPYVISIQGLLGLYYEVTRNLSFKLHSYFENYLVKKSKYFGGRTKWADDFVRSINGDATIFYMPEAVNVLYFDESNAIEKHDILYVGSVEPRKGLHIAIRALAIVTKKYPVIRLNMVGGCNKDYLNCLMGLSQELGVNNNIAWLGMRRPEEIKKLQSESLMFIFPTLIDNSPNSVCEAMASGLPVITSNAGGLPSIVQHGENGLLFESGNHIHLADNIIFLLENESKRLALGEEAKKVAFKRHFPPTVALQTLEVYRQVLTNERR
jgi:glycosyltransferase involved in cell wall biosynthesis